MAWEGATGAIAAFARRALENRPIVIPGDPLRVRDFVYVDDVVAAFEAIAEQGRWGETLTIASGRPTPLLLRYNTGLRIADNGAALSLLLTDLVERWPVPVHRIDLVGHSMGGLVLRHLLGLFGRDPGLLGGPGFGFGLCLLRLLAPSAASRTRSCSASRAFSVAATRVSSAASLSSWSLARLA